MVELMPGWRPEPSPGDVLVSGLPLAPLAAWFLIVGNLCLAVVSLSRSRRQ